LGEAHAVRFYIPATGFSVGFDGRSNSWKLYNGSGAARAYSFALTRFG
jgi:hypothetical protein